ncbi:MAG: hypothetical protein EXR77_12675 [Myxococcales bacterium]|nr:hypothetical protein [Myxococcales bacterium]
MTPRCAQSGGSRTVRALPALLWMAAIWLSSARPWPQASNLIADFLLTLPQFVLALLVVVPPDKVIHLLVYAVLAGLWWWALLPGRADLPRGRAMAAWAIAVVFGGIDELHQGFVAGRSRDAADWGADAMGALLAVVLLAALQQRQTKRAAP